MYTLKTVGSTKSPVKDDSEILELEDVSNKIVEHTTENTDHKKLNKSLSNDREMEKKSIGLFLWSILQFFGLVSLAIIIYTSIKFKHGFFGELDSSKSVVINQSQLCNWHYTLAALGFIYLFGNSIFMIIENKDVTVSFVMLHSLAFLTSTISIAIIVIRREMTKVHDSNIWTFKSILYGHLYTLHSWIGATTLLMFLLQWLSSVLIFMIPCLQYKGLPLGKKFSLSTLFIATTALLTGVNEHAVYSLKQEYKLFTQEGLFLNCFGISMLLFTLSVSFAIFRLRN